jgi:hypothetical protein
LAIIPPDGLSARIHHEEALILGITMNNRYLYAPDKPFMEPWVLHEYSNG